MCEENGNEQGLSEVMWDLGLRTQKREKRQALEKWDC